MFDNEHMEEIFKSYVHESKKRGSSLIYTKESLAKIVQNSRKSKLVLSNIHKTSKSLSKNKKGQNNKL